MASRESPRLAAEPSLKCFNDRRPGFASMTGALLHERPELAGQARGRPTKVPELGADQHVHSAEVTLHVCPDVVCIPALPPHSIRVTDVDVVTMPLPPVASGDRYFDIEAGSRSVLLDRHDFTHAPRIHEPAGPDCSDGARAKKPVADSGCTPDGRLARGQCEKAAERVRSKSRVVRHDIGVYPRGRKRHSGSTTPSSPGSRLASTGAGFCPHP